MLKLIYNILNTYILFIYLRIYILKHYFFINIMLLLFINSITFTKNVDRFFVDKFNTNIQII